MKAFPCDESGNVIDKIDVFEGGAGAEVEKLSIATDTPDDYLEFWDWLKTEVNNTKPEILLHEKNINQEKGYVVKDYQIKSPFDSFATCRVIYPLHAEKNSLKMKFLYMGYGINTCNCGFEPGCIAIQTNAHAINNYMSEEYYKNLAKNELKMYGFNDEENKNPKTAYWVKMMARNLQVVRFFKDHELADKSNYIFIGESQGAMQAVNMAAHSGIATYCAASRSWLCDIYGSTRFGRMKGWRPEPQNGLRYFDTDVAAKHLKCEIQIEVGLGDYVCPPSELTAMFNDITASKKIKYMQNRTHSYSPVTGISYDF